MGVEKAQVGIPGRQTVYLKSSQTQEKFILTSRSHEEPEGIRRGCDPVHWQWRGFLAAHLQMQLVVRCMREDKKQGWQDGCRKLAPCLQAGAHSRYPPYWATLPFVDTRG